MKYLLLLPAVMLFLVFTAWPLAEVVRLSTFQTNFIVTRFIGLGNYIAAFSSPAFLQSIGNSFLYCAIMVPAIAGSALGIALLVFHMSKRWQDATRLILYLPALSAGLIISQFWKWIFHARGPANWLLSLLGLPAMQWWAQTATAVPIISTAISMASLGGYLIMVLAAMLSIDRSLLDAARIDGASTGQVNRRIILPLVMPTFLLVCLLVAISAFQIWENIYALAPYDHAATMTWEIYKAGFQASRYGLASAEAIVLVAIMLLLASAKGRVEKWGT